MSRTDFSAGIARFHSQRIVHEPADCSVLSFAMREVIDACTDIDPDRLHSDGEAILKLQASTDSQSEDLLR